MQGANPEILAPLHIDVLVNETDYLRCQYDYISHVSVSVFIRLPFLHYKLKSASRENPTSTPITPMTTGSLYNTIAAPLMHKYSQCMYN